MADADAVVDPGVPALSGDPDPGRRRWLERCGHVVWCAARSSDMVFSERFGVRRAFAVASAMIALA